MFERQDDMQTDGDPAAEFDLDAPAGNRPAQNARHVDATAALPREWRGADNAADFLGLDQEVQAPTATAPAYGATQPGAPLEAGAPTNSWLLALDDAQSGAAGLDPIADPGADGADLPAPLETSYAETAPKRRVGGLLMPAIAAATLLGLGVALWKIYSLPKPSTETTTAALAPDPTRPNATKTPRPTTPKGATTPTTAGSAPRGVDFGRDASGSGPIDRTRPDEEVLLVDGASGDAHADDAKSGESTGGYASGTDTATPPLAIGESAAPTAPDRAAAEVYVADASRPAAERFEAWLRVYGRSASPELDLIGDYDPTRPHDFVDNFSGMLPHAAGAPFLRTTGGAPSRATDPSATTTARTDSDGNALTRRDGRDDVEDETPAKTSGIRRASKADLAGLWEGSAIPVEAIGASSRLLTPAVGRVRVILKGGEIFEGRLYAVGDHKIWLDTELGRMALLGDQVRKIDQLSGKGTPGTPDLAGLPRVRVRTPGGMFYGKVIARDQQSVTLVTEEGARVTLDSTDVEDAPLGKTYLVKP